MGSEEGDVKSGNELEFVQDTDCRFSFVLCYLDFDPFESHNEEPY